MRHLADRPRRVLLALLPAILGEEAAASPPDGFESSVDAMLDRMAIADRRAVRLLLGFLQISPVFYFEGRNFTGLTPSRRAAHFARLARSRNPLFRRAASVAKTLAAYNVYGQPGAWPGVGYDGPWVGRVEVERLADPDLGTGGPRRD